MLLLCHFTIVDDKDERLPEITVRVCESLTCSLFGSEKLYEELTNKYKGKVRVLKAPCMGKCDYAPALEVEHNHVDNATLNKVDKVISNKLFNPVISKFIDLKTILVMEVIHFLKLKSKEVTYEQISKVISESNLRGLGGAGFPASKKWEFVRANKGPRMMCINGDEGEVGTFKDKYYLDTVLIDS